MIYTELMAHQKLMVNFAKNKKYVAFFAEYGTGKTLTVLKLLDVLKCPKVLVISSKTAIQSTWPEEIRKHSNFRFVHLIGNVNQKLNNLVLGLRQVHVTEARHNSTAIPIIFLVNFDGVKNVYDELAKIKFDYIIVDESTKIKSPKTLRSKVMWALGRTAKRRCIMTGFPVTENLTEIYSQIKFLDNGKNFGPSYYHFLNAYFYRAGFKWKVKTSMEKRIFTSLKPFCIRITDDVLKLPPKVYNTKIIEPTIRQRELLNEFKNYFRIELGKVKIDTQYIFTLIGKSLQICDGFLQDDKGNREILETAKDEALIDLIDEIDPQKHKIVIWAIFRFSIYKIKKIVESLGYNALTLTGATPNVDSVIKKFQNSKKYPILIATQKKAAESITLTACKHAIYYSNTWSYDLRVNSEARIRRKGSEKHDSIFYTDIILKDSVEDLVYKCLRDKKNLVDTLKKNFKTIISK